MASLVCDGRCWCISRRGDGYLLVGTYKSLQIMKTDGTLSSSISTKGYVTGACELMGSLYLLLDDHNLRKVSVWNRRSLGGPLEEINSWVVKGSSCQTNLAVLGQKILIPDPDNGLLRVYTADGKRSPQHVFSGEPDFKPDFVSTHGFDVIMSDSCNGKVRVYDTSSSGYRFKFEYKKRYPTAAAVSPDGSLYVGSRDHGNNLHVVSSTGQLIDEREVVSGCWGLNIAGDELLAATSDGLYLYQLGR